MSAAAIADSGAAPAAKGGGKKKLIVILAAVLVLLGALGGGAVFYVKKKAAAAAEAAEADGDEKPAEHHAADSGHLVPPVYLPLDPFVINLADRDSDRYAQIGITLELQDAAFAERMKAYMPAVRNAILLTITRKTSRELLDVNGKEQLAEQIKRDAVRPLGIDIPAPEPVTEAASGMAMKKEKKAADEDEDEDPKPKKKKKKAEMVKNPVQQVNFSSFIIQ